MGVCVLYLDSCAIYFVCNNELFFSNDSRVNCTVAVKSEIYYFPAIVLLFYPLVSGVGEPTFRQQHVFSQRWLHTSFTPFPSQDQELTKVSLKNEH